MCVCENVRGVCIKVCVFECECERSVQSEENMQSRVNV